MECSYPPGSYLSRTPRRHMLAPFRETHIVEPEESPSTGEEYDCSLLAKTWHAPQTATEH